MPSRDVLNAQLVGTLAAPLTGLARTLNALIVGIAVQLGQIRDQGLVSGTSAAAEEAPVAAEPEAGEAEKAPAVNEDIEAAEEPEAANEPAAEAAAEAAPEATETDAAAAADDSEADSSSAEEAPAADAAPEN